MAGHHIALLRLLRLKKALQATVTCPQFQDLNAFQDIARILLNTDLWVYLFIMCRALYAPMRVLHLADQKVAAMDKLHYFVMQANQIMPKYLKEAECHFNLLSLGMKKVIDDTTDLASEVVEEQESDEDLEIKKEDQDSEVEDDEAYSDSDDGLSEDYVSNCYYSSLCIFSKLFFLKTEHPTF